MAEGPGLVGLRTGRPVPGQQRSCSLEHQANNFETRRVQLRRIYKCIHVRRLPEKHGPQHLIPLLHHHPAVVRPINTDHKVARPLKGDVVIPAISAAGFGCGVNRDIEHVVLWVKILPLSVKIEELFVILHGQATLFCGEDYIILCPLRGISVHIGNAFLHAGVKGQEAKVLLVGLVIAPIGGIVQIHVCHGVPGALEPLVLPGEHAAARTSGSHDILITVDDGLALLLLGHMSLIAPGVDIPLGHAPTGGDPILGDYHRDGVVIVEHLDIGVIGVRLAAFVVKVCVLVPGQHILNKNIVLRMLEPVYDLLPKRLLILKFNWIEHII